MSVRDKRYVRDPQTAGGCTGPIRTSAWLVTEVPELRIVGRRHWQAGVGLVGLDPRPPSGAEARTAYQLALARTSMLSCAGAHRSRRSLFAGRRNKKPGED